MEMHEEGSTFELQLFRRRRTGQSYREFEGLTYLIKSVLDRDRMLTAWQGMRSQELSSKDVVHGNVKTGTTSGNKNARI